ncbi:hypothetical protein ACSBR2_017913 [Camellia fascicularis]
MCLSNNEEDGGNNFDDVSVPSLALTVTASPLAHLQVFKSLLQWRKYREHKGGLKRQGQL